LCEFTGISHPYEEPLTPEIRLDTSVQSIPDATFVILSKLTDLGYLPDSGSVRLRRRRPKRGDRRRRA
jgi:hypothetical protein